MIIKVKSSKITSNGMRAKYIAYRREYSQGLDPQALLGSNN